jgi:hypothetical protein
MADLACAALARSSEAVIGAAEQTVAQCGNATTHPLRLPFRQ